MNLRNINMMNKMVKIIDTGKVLPDIAQSNRYEWPSKAMRDMAIALYWRNKNWEPENEMMGKVVHRIAAKTHKNPVYVLEIKNKFESMYVPILEDGIELVKI